MVCPLPARNEPQSDSGLPLVWSVLSVNVLPVGCPGLSLSAALGVPMVCPWSARVRPDRLCPTRGLLWSSLIWPCPWSVSIVTVVFPGLLLYFPELPLSFS